MSAKLESLARVPLFEGLATGELESVAARTRELRIEAGTEVTRQGDPGTEFYVITAGALEIRIDGRAVNILRRGDFLGELALLFGAPRNASAVALEPTTLLVMNKDEFTALLADQPAVESKVLAVVAQRLRYR
jgi:CRP/FNR family transcriptional regulator, cyclic AMP receptor protein